MSILFNSMVSSVLVTLKRATAPVCFYLGALTLLGAAPALAAPVTWCLNDAQFSDGTSLTGGLVYDADQTLPADRILDYDMQTEAAESSNPEAPFPATNYTPLTTPVVFSNLLRYTFRVTGQTFNGTQDLQLALDFASSLTNDGGAVALDTSPNRSFECWNCSPSRKIVSGELVSTTESLSSCPTSAGAPSAVPTLPKTGLFLMIALLGLFGLGRLTRI